AWATAAARCAACCSMRSPRTPSRRRSPIPSTSTRRKSTRSRRGACSTGWSATRPRRCSGRASRRACRPAGCRQWRCGRAAGRLGQQRDGGARAGAEGPVGLIAYMPADALRVADAAVAQARDFVVRQFDKRSLPATPNVHKTGKGQSRVQDAHEAIRPADVLRRPDDLKQHLDAKQFKLYQLIWRRFVASQMNPAVFETTKVDFDLVRYVFRATASRVLFDGYHKLYHEAHEPEEGKTLEDLPPIPPLVEGDVVTVKQITPNQHFTEPRPRFSEAI